MNDSREANRFPPVLPVYKPLDVAFDHGEGCYLFDTEGKRYLDFSSGIAVTALGHVHPHLVEALERQAEKLWHTANLVRIPEQERMAERLVEATFADSVFFTNSGVEAIECALKLTRKYFSESDSPARYRVITFQNAFHGRSLAAIAAAGKEAYIKGFGPMPEGFDPVPFGDVDAVRDAITDETAGILIEPVQGEGGIFPLPLETLRSLRQIADEAGILLILDEIQCGMGRTGRLFAHEWAGIKPDIMAVAKALGGGFPVGACLATEAVAAAMPVGSHGSTYGGNPLAMAVANAVLDEMLAPGFMDHVVDMGNRLRTGLESLRSDFPDQIGEIRGLGLMIGMECTAPARALREALLDEGMLAAQAGTNVLRLLPPLIIEESHVAEAINKLAKIFAAVD